MSRLLGQNSCARLKGLRHVRPYRPLGRPNPSFNAPRVMILAITLGSLTSWIFVIVLLFVMTDIDGVISSAAGPLLTIYYQATTSRAGATCLRELLLMGLLIRALLIQLIR